MLQDLITFCLCFRPKMFSWSSNFSYPHFGPDFWKNWCNLVLFVKFLDTDEGFFIKIEPFIKIEDVNKSDLLC